MKKRRPAKNEPKYDPEYEGGQVYESGRGWTRRDNWQPRDYGGGGERRDYGGNRGAGYQMPDYSRQAVEQRWNKPEGKPWKRKPVPYQEYLDPISGSVKPGYSQARDGEAGGPMGQGNRDAYFWQQHHYGGGAKGYQPGYFDDPQRLAGYYHALENASPGEGEGLHPWLDDNQDDIRTAYQYMKFRNNDKPWYMWDYLDADDAGREFIGGMAQPPDELLRFGEERFRVAGDGMGAGEFDPEGTYDEMFGEGEMQQGGLSEADYEALPMWQKAMMAVFSSPKAAGATLGGTLGVTGGPMGVAGGAALGGALGGLIERNPKLADYLLYLDYPANWLEQSIGTVGMALDAPWYAKSGERLDAFQKVLSDLPSAWQAARLTYETAGLGFGGGEGVYQLGTPEMIDLDDDEMGFNARMEAFDRIQGGESPEQVYQDISARMGFSGLARDMIGHIAIDPLNWLGALGGPIGALGVEPFQMIGRITGNDALMAAGRGARGPIEAGQMYRTLLRTGNSMDELAQAGTFGRWMAGVADPAKAVDAMRLRMKGVDDVAALSDDVVRAVGDGGKLVDTGLIPIGKPGMFNRLAGAATTGGIGTLLGYGLGGPVGGMIGGALGGGYGMKQGFSFLSNLTPAARSQEVVNNGALNLAVLLERAETPDEMVRFIKGVGNMDLSVARELSMKTLDAPEGAALPMMMRDFGGKADEMLYAWDATQHQRHMLEAIGDVTGRSSAQVLGDLGEGGVRADGLLRQYVDVAREQIASGGQYADDAAEIVRAFEAGDLTVEGVRGLAKSFVEDGLAYTPEQFRAQLYANSIEHSAKWAADWFGVQPEPGMIRLANTIKSAQSLVLLGLNPTYFVNNAINNMVTMAARGVMGLRRPDTLVDLWARVGVQPERLKQGLGLALESEGITLDAIREAQRAGDVLDTAQDVMRAANDKVGVFSKLSGKMEEWSSAQAMTAGFSQAWGRLWRKDAGFDAMPSALERALDAVDPNLKGMIYEAIQGGMNRGEIEGALWSGMNRRGVDAFIPEVGEKYGLTEADASEMLRHSGAYDFLGERMRGGDVSDRGVVRAFRDLEDEVLRTFDEAAVEGLVNEAGRMAETVKGEGAQAGLWAHSQLALEKMATRAQDVSEWQKVFSQRNEVEPAVYQALVDAQVRRERGRYARLNKKESAAYVGIANALGFDNQLSRDFVGSVGKVQATWKDFYRQKWELMRGFFNKNWDGADDGARKAGWEAVQKEINGLGDAARDAEISAASQMSETFGEMFRLQYGDEAGRLASQWYEGVVESRFELGVEFSKFYDDMLEQGITGGAERDAAFDQFWQEVWLPKLMEGTNRNLQGADEMYGLIKGAGGEGVGRAVPGGGDVPPAGGLFGDDVRVAAEDLDQPFMVSAEMRRGLKELGWGTDEISGMEVRRAIEILEAGEWPGQGVFEVADEYGLQYLADDGRPRPGADFQLFAIASRYGGEAMESVQSFDELVRLDDGDEILRAALDERKVYRDAYGEMSGVEGRTPWGTQREAGIDRVRAEQALDEARKNLERDMYGRDLDALKNQGELINEVVDTPRGELPDGISQAVADEAAQMLSELGSGQAERIYRAADISQRGDAGYVRGTSNVGWYSRLSKEGYANRKSISGALGRIIEDAGKDAVRKNEVTLPRVKQLIVERMLGDVDSGMPPHPGLLLLLGREDDAVDAFRQYWDEPTWAQAATDDEWLKLAGSEEALDALFKGLGERTFEGDAALLADDIPASAVEMARAADEITDLQRVVREREAVQLKADEWQAEIDGQLGLLRDDPDLTREYMRDGMVRVWGLSDEQADAWTGIMDARARAWAKENGRTAGEFWSEYMGGMVESQESLVRGGMGQAVEQVAQRVLREKYPEIDAYVWERGNQIELSKVVVPEGQRGQGVGTQFMDDLVQYADEQGKVITLTPDVSFGGTSRGRLTDFYKRFGFVENKGRHKVYETQAGMYRVPDGGDVDALFQAGDGRYYQAAERYTDTPAFKEWFGDSKVVDANDKPMVLYHGTTHNFREFTRQFANQESRWGDGFYFTDDLDDVNRNYAGMGPDLTNRIERAAERIDAEWDMDAAVYADDVADLLGKDVDDVYRMIDDGDFELDMDQARAIAKKQLSENEGLVMPVHVRMENPLRIENANYGEGTRFHAEYDAGIDPTDMADLIRERFEDSPDDLAGYVDELDDLIDAGGNLPDELALQMADDGDFRWLAEEAGYEIELRFRDDAGNEFDLIGALRDNAYQYSDIEVETTILNLLDNFGYDEWYNVSAEELFEFLRNDEGLNMMMDYDTGDMVMSQYLQDVVRDLGYDGIVMDAGRAFPNMEGVQGTNHYIAFEPTNIKSVFNQGTWDAGTPDILRQASVTDAAKGAVTFADDGRAVMHALGAQDFSTLVHETGHVFRRTLGVEDLDVAGRWAGAEQVDDVWRWTEPAEEKFARGFERWIAEGRQGAGLTDAVVVVFEKMKRWMLEIYNGIRGTSIDVDLSPEIRGVFERMLDEDMGGDYQVLYQKKGRPGQMDMFSGGEDLPLFSGSAQKGVDDVFAPVEQAQQGVMPGFEDALKPQMKGAKQAGADQGAWFGTEGGMKRLLQRGDGEVMTDVGGVESQAFKRWFGDSKVLDHKGEPLRVFHGTKADAFDAFDPGKFGETTDSGWYGEGFYFTQEPDYASGYARGDGGQVMPVYLNIQNPYVTSGLLKNEFKGMDAAEMTQAVKDMGHDGVIYYHKGFKGELTDVMVDGVYDKVQGLVSWATPSRVEKFVGLSKADIREIFREGISPWDVFKKLGIDNTELYKLKVPQDERAIMGEVVAFDPGQIKSTYNRGTWDADDGRILYQNSDGSMGQAPMDGAAPQGGGMAPGTVRGEAGQVPVQQMTEQGWNEKVWPMLLDIQKRMLGKDGKVTISLNDAVGQVDDAAMGQLRMYLEQVYGQMGETKLASMRWGENRRDAALLNYGRRYGVDNFLTSMVPYQFWGTRSAGEWIKGGIDRPAWLANYARLQHMQDRVTAQPGFPTRLQGKMRIPVPGLPEWAGGGVYIDPLHQMFPFTQVPGFSSYDRAQEEKDQYAKRAGYALQDLVGSGEISAQQARAAWEAGASGVVESEAGQLWTRVYNEAKVGVDGEEGSVPDYLQMLVSPLLPVNWLAKYAQGEEDEIGLLPATRTIQALTSGVKPGGVNIEAPLRNALGLPERGQMGDFYIDRELSNMVADGSITLDQSRAAMIERGGAAYEMALDRVGKQQAAKTLGGSSLWLDFFPEGEEEQRKLQQVFSAAIDSGDPEAVNEFFEQYPEYGARLMAMDWDDPESRMRQFLIGQVWDGYGEQPELHRRQIQEQLGDAFGDAFLNKETRSYDSIPTETLARWAQAFGAEHLPGVPMDGGQMMGQGMGMGMGQGMELAGADETALYEMYQTEKGERWPRLGAVQQMYYGLDTEGEKDAFLDRFPELREYWGWKTQMQAEYPGLIPHLTSEQSNLYGVDPKIAQNVYQFRATRDEMFPGIFDLQGGYFELPEKSQGRRDYLKDHPELKAYWEWKRNVMEEYPEIEPYVTRRDSIDDIAVEALGEQGVYLDPGRMSAPLLSQVMRASVTGEAMGSGAMRALRRLWEQDGEPGESFEDWVDGILETQK